MTPPSPGDLPRVERDRQGWRVLAILSLLMGFASVSTDLYLPAMPAMGQALRVSAGQIEWTVSSYLVGFSVGQLVWGPIGDRYGRRGPIIAGLVLFTIGSAGCAMATGIGPLIVARLLQALGASASVVLARAMVRDLYEGPAAARMMSSLMTVMAVAPLLGPLAGGQMLAVAGWRAIFWFLVVVGLATLAAMPIFPETLPAARRDRRPLAKVYGGYGALIRDRRLLAYAGAGGFFYAGMFAYIAGSPHVFIVVHGVSPQTYGLLFAAGVAGIMAANALNARLVQRIGSDRLLVLGSAGAAVSGLFLAANVGPGWAGLVGVVVPLFLFTGMAGFIVANSIVGALALSTDKAGSVSALIGAAQYGAGIAGSAVLGAFNDGTARPLAYVIAICGVGAVVCALLASKAE